MFSNVFRNDFVETLGILGKSEYVFHFTGSFSWKQPNIIKEDSDLDLFVEDGSGVREFLLGLGFKEIKKQVRNYVDSNCVTVFSKKFGGPWKIDIQVVSNIKDKVLAQKILMKLFPEGFSSKKEGGDIWCLVLKMVSLGLIKEDLVN